MITRDVMDLLALRHKNDVFVAECKTGPTTVGRHVRLDGWAMKRSWVSPRTYGYEVKVARTDFLRDDKWHAYLPYCSDFYFVTAPGVINSIDEIPAEAGWIKVSTNGRRLLTKKKAPARLDTEIPPALYQYLLMSRTRIVSRWSEDAVREAEPDDRAAYWRLWAAEKIGKAVIGRSVSKRVRDLVHEAGLKLAEADRRDNTFDAVRTCLAHHGIDSKDPSSWSVNHRLQELRQLVTSADRSKVRDAARAINALVAQLEEGE